MGNSTTIRLQYPFTLGGVTYDELTIRRPKMRDIKRSERHKEDLNKSLNMIADLAEIAPEVVEEMDPVDFAAISEVVGDFMWPSAA